MLSSKWKVRIPLVGYSELVVEFPHPVTQLEALQKAIESEDWNEEIDADPYLSVHAQATATPVEE